MEKYFIFVLASGSGGLFNGRAKYQSVMLKMKLSYYLCFFSNVITLDALHATVHRR